MPPNKGPGRRRKWYSDRCRKQALYSRPCERCGAPMSGSEGHGPHAPMVCRSCDNAAFGERSRARHRTLREEVERAWAAGLTIREMGERFGWTHPQACISQARSRGYDLPYRRPPETVEKLRASWARVREEREHANQG